MFHGVFCPRLQRCLVTKFHSQYAKGCAFFFTNLHINIFSSFLSYANFCDKVFTFNIYVFREEEKSFFIHQVCTFCPEEPQSVWERGSHLHWMKKKLFWFLFFAFVAASIFHENFNKNNIVVPRHLEEWNKLLRAEKHNCPVWI